MAVTAWKNETGSNALDVATSLALHDVALAFAISDSSSTTFTWPSGFTELATQGNTFDGQQIGVAIKPDCTGSEGTLTLNASGTIVGGIVGISGMDNSTQPDVATPTPANNNSGMATPWTISLAITPATNGAMILSFMGSDAAVAVAHTFADTGALSWTTATDINQSGSTFRHGGIGYATQATAAATTVTGTGTAASGSAGRSMILVALKPAAASGPNITTLMGQACF